MRGLSMIGLLARGALLAAFAGGTARAQSDYPNKPIRLVVGFTPGSVADITARVLGNRMGQILGQQVVVENKPGAGSNLAAEFVARSPKDGYTLFLPGSANIANAAINPNLPFDIVKDFAPIALVNAAAVILVVHPSLGGQQRAGTDRAGEIQARRTELCLHRDRQRAASLRRAVHAAHRDQARARALSGQPAGGDRPACRPRPGHVLAGHGRDLAGRRTAS